VQIIQLDLTTSIATGSSVSYGEIPPNLLEQTETTRQKLVEILADLDDEIAEIFINEEEPTPEQLRQVQYFCSLLTRSGIESPTDRHYYVVTSIGDTETNNRSHICSRVNGISL
jgi:hypothetical protein